MASAALHVPFVTACPVPLSDRIMIAYRDATLSTEEFEAIVRDVWGDLPEDDQPSSDTIAERHHEIGAYRAGRGRL